MVSTPEKEQTRKDGSNDVRPEIQVKTVSENHTNSWSKIVVGVWKNSKTVSNIQINFNEIKLLGQTKIPSYIFFYSSPKKLLQFRGYVVLAFESP